jgi:hypothetical protein
VYFFSSRDEIDEKDEFDFQAGFAAVKRGGPGAIWDSKPPRLQQSMRQTVAPLVAQRQGAAFRSNCHAGVTIARWPEVDTQPVGKSYVRRSQQSPFHLAPPALQIVRPKPGAVLLRLMNGDLPIDAMLNIGGREVPIFSPERVAELKGLPALPASTLNPMP